jgi:DNA helicase-2/ATP-dependent DNA helicase PcrA
MRNFETEYEKLNQSQKQAVDTLDGPLLVVAGPGTGKTQLLSLRVANILRATDTKPANVLCLTYTNKAAINMKSRIIQLAGSESSRLPVKTFHSFAGEIMNLYPDHFWNAARLSVAPESVQIEIIESIVTALLFDNPLAQKFAGQYTLIKDIKQAISLAKDAGLTPDKLRSLINFNLAYIDQVETKLIEMLKPKLSIKVLYSLLVKVSALESQSIDRLVYPLISLSTIIKEGLESSIELDSVIGKTTNTGAWKKRWVQIENGNKGMFGERRRNQWWLRLADVYQSYLEQMHARGYYDYSDMLVEVITKLEQSPELLADIQERFSYVLIDEFQDTTLAQLRLANLVAEHYSSEGRPNLMVVGDDDQTIFKFSGAELNNMLGFKRRYPDTKTIVLTENYRSSQAVLDSARNVIEQAENRLVNQDRTLNKNLRAANPPKTKSEICALNYSSRELQFSDIARKISNYYSTEKHIAVLARGHDSLLKMAGILQGINVPIRYEYRSNILEHDLIKQIDLIARLTLAIRNGNKDECNSIIHNLIRHPMWGINPAKLWEMAVNNYHHSDWTKSLLSSKDQTVKLAGEWFVWLAAEDYDQPLTITLEYLLGLRDNGIFKSPIKQYYLESLAHQPKQYFESLSAIQMLRSLVHEFAKNGEPNIQDLIKFIEINNTNNLVIADESPFITGEHAVHLMTVFKSKGLEFDDVYIIDAVEDNWQPRKGKRQPPANLPLQPAGDDLDDYIRLMYVAITRAKSNITISSYYQNHAGKDVATSPIIQSAFNIRLITETDNVKLIEVLEENLHWPELSGGEEKSMLKAILDTYSLSVTHLLNFLDIEKGGPKYFKERNLLRLPEAKTLSLAYGTAMHSALETAQLLINQSQFKLDSVVKDYANALSSQQLSKSDYKRYYERGAKALSRILIDFGYVLPTGSLPEQDLKDVKIGDARIRGKLDRVDIDGNHVSIIDYKTGNPLSSFEAKSKAEALKSHKHKLQLIFYALLAKEHPRFNSNITFSGEMIYLEADNIEQLSRTYFPSSKEIERISKLVKAVYAHIMDLDFPDVSNYSADIEGVIAFEDYLINKINK